MRILGQICKVYTEKRRFLRQLTCAQRCGRCFHHHAHRHIFIEHPLCLAQAALCLVHDIQRALHLFARGYHGQRHAQAARHTCTKQRCKLAAQQLGMRQAVTHAAQPKGGVLFRGASKPGGCLSVLKS